MQKKIQKIPKQRTQLERKARPVLSSKTSSEAQCRLESTMSKGALCIGVYAVLCTNALGGTSYFLSMKCEIKSTVNGNKNQIRNENKYDVFSWTCLKMAARIVLSGHLWVSKSLR